MASTVVTLNSQQFWTAGPVQPYLVQPLSTPIATGGARERGANRKLNRFIENQWHVMGLGWNRKDRNTGWGVGGLRDSTCETRFRIAELALLHETQTHAGPADHPKKYVNFLGDFWGIFEEDRPLTGNGDIVARKYGATLDDWTGGGTVGTSAVNSVRPWDAFVHKGRLVVVGQDEASVLRPAVYDSPDGITWTKRNGTGFPALDFLAAAVIERNNFDDDGGRGLDFGNVEMVAFWDNRAAGTGQFARVYYSTDQGVNWTAGAVIPSGSGPKAFVAWNNPLATGNPIVPILVTAEGIYRVDSAAATFDLLFALDGDPNNGRWSVVGLDGALWVPLGSGAILRLEIESQNTLTVTYVSPGGPEGDGFVSTRQGFAHSLLAPPLPWLFVAYGGQAASRNASVFAIEYTPRIDPISGKRFYAWHHMYREADANIDLYLLGYSSEDDATPRLHFALESATSAEMFHLERPDVPGAASGVAQKKQTTGFIEFAEDDLGDPNISGALLRAYVDADDLSASDAGEFIEHEYGINGAAWTNVSDFGNFISGDKQLTFGLSNQNITGQTESGTQVGVSALTFRARLVLNRDAGDNTQSPKLKEYELQARKRYEVLQGFRFGIDLALTAQNLKVRTEEVIARINTIVTSVVLVPFTYGEMVAINVEATRYQSEFTQAMEGTFGPSESRQGIYLLEVEQVLP